MSAQDDLHKVLQTYDLGPIYSALKSPGSLDSGCGTFHAHNTSEHLPITY